MDYPIFKLLYFYCHVTCDIKEEVLKVKKIPVVTFTVINCTLWRKTSRTILSRKHPSTLGPQEYYVSFRHLYGHIECDRLIQINIHQPDTSLTSVLKIVFHGAVAAHESFHALSNFKSLPLS